MISTYTIGALSPESPRFPICSHIDLAVRPLPGTSDADPAGDVTCRDGRRDGVEIVARTPCEIDSAWWPAYA